MKTYDELPDYLKEEARKLHPKNYTEWLYKIQGVEIYFSCSNNLWNIRT